VRPGITAALVVLSLSALALPPAKADPTIMPDTDMTGSDLRHFELPKPRPRLCQEACFNDEACRAWTFLREGLLGPLAVCWLKSGTPVPRPDPCCVSGLK
jgi:hypothetical protein